MGFDYEKAEQEFKDELEAGKFSIELLPNTESDYQTDEERDLAAFQNYLKSDTYKLLSNKVFR